MCEEALSNLSVLVVIMQPNESVCVIAMNRRQEPEVGLLVHEDSPKLRVKFEDGYLENKHEANHEYKEKEHEKAISKLLSIHLGGNIILQLT